MTGTSARLAIGEVAKRAGIIDAAQRVWRLWHSPRTLTTRGVAPSATFTA